jgi:hypothetical protein
MPILLARKIHAFVNHLAKKSLSSFYLEGSQFTSFAYRKQVA